MHWAHANTAANNYSVGLITVAYKEPGSSVWVQQWADPHFKSKPTPAEPGPKCGNHAEPRTKQHNMAQSPHAPDVQRKKDSEGETALYFTAVSQAARAHPWPRLHQLFPLPVSLEWRGSSILGREK